VSDATASSHHDAPSRAHSRWAEVSCRESALTHRSISTPCLTDAGRSRATANTSGTSGRLHMRSAEIECTLSCTGLYTFISAGTGGDASSGARTVGGGSAGGADARVKLREWGEAQTPLTPVLRTSPPPHAAVQRPAELPRACARGRRSPRARTSGGGEFLSTNPAAPTAGRSVRVWGASARAEGEEQRSAWG
jgi:hypothetical protein